MTLEHAAEEGDIEEKQNERLLRGNTEILKGVRALEERILALERAILAQVKAGGGGRRVRTSEEDVARRRSAAANGPGIIGPMTERSAPEAGAIACPFVAFVDDRDQRAEVPDHRHRCYAEIRPRRGHSPTSRRSA